MKACMNVDNGRGAGMPSRTWIMAAAVLMWSSRSFAVEPPHSPLDLWPDPYNTRPPLLAHGRALPGDTAISACPLPVASGTLQLSLSKAVDIALCNNSKIRAAWAAIKERAAGVGIASAAQMPTVSMTAGRERTDTSYPSTAVPTNVTRGNTINASLNWRLFDFGAREAERQAANSLLSAAIHSHDAIVQQVMADTVQAYFDTQSADAVMRAKQQGVTIAQAILNSAHRRENSGAASHNDTLQASTALARAGLDLNRARGEYEKARSILIYTTGLPVDSRIEIDPDNGSVPDLQPGTSSSPAEELNEWLQVTGRSHPAILAADKQLQAAQNDVKSASAQGLPTLDFSASYYQNGYPNQGLSTNRNRIGNVGLFVSIPIFSGFSHRYQVGQAKAVAEERQANLDDTRHNVLMQVVKAHADARAALNNLASSDALLAAAQASLESSQRRYDKGAADILEILNVQKEVADAQQDRIRCIAEWRAARLRLMAEAGLLGHGELAEPTADRALQVPIKALPHADN
jgi:outer membrane protein